MTSSYSYFLDRFKHTKRLHDLVKAFKKLESNTERKLKLIIAGKVYNQSNFKTIKNEIDASENILLMQNRIANEDVQHYFKAANVCVCPYRITLNSELLICHTLLEHRSLAQMLEDSKNCFQMEVD